MSIVYDSRGWARRCTSSFISSYVRRGDDDHATSTLLLLSTFLPCKALWCLWCIREGCVLPFLLCAFVCVLCICLCFCAKELVINLFASWCGELCYMLPNFFVYILPLCTLLACFCLDLSAKLFWRLSLLLLFLSWSAFIFQSVIHDCLVVHL